jgi:hypothetical protein
VCSGIHQICAVQCHWCLVGAVTASHVDLRTVSGCPLAILRCKPPPILRFHPLLDVHVCTPAETRVDFCVMLMPMSISTQVTGYAVRRDAIYTTLEDPNNQLVKVTKYFRFGYWPVLFSLVASSRRVLESGCHRRPVSYLIGRTMRLAPWTLSCFHSLTHVDTHLYHVSPLPSQPSQSVPRCTHFLTTS